MFVTAELIYSYHIEITPRISTTKFFFEISIFVLESRFDLNNKDDKPIHREDLNKNSINETCAAFDKHISVCEILYLEIYEYRDMVFIFIKQLLLNLSKISSLRNIE